MDIQTVVLVASASLGVAGSLSFAIGVIDQSPRAMALLSTTFWGKNDHIVESFARQKADYLCGAVLILLAFSIQLLPTLVPGLEREVPAILSENLAVSALLFTAALLALQRVLAKWLTARNIASINAQLSAMAKERESKKDAS